MAHEQLHFLYRGFPRASHPMAVLLGATASLSAFYHDSLDMDNPEHRELSCYRMIAKMPTLAAMAYKYSIGQPFIYPQNDLGFAENFLHMLFSTPCEKYVVNPVLADAMDKILILHADHEQKADGAREKQSLNRSGRHSAGGFSGRNLGSWQTVAQVEYTVSSPVVCLGPPADRYSKIKSRSNGRALRFDYPVSLRQCTVSRS